MTVALDEFTEYISDEWPQNDQLIWKCQTEITSNSMKIRTKYRYPFNWSARYAEIIPYKDMIRTIPITMKNDMTSTPRILLDLSKGMENANFSRYRANNEGLHQKSDDKTQ